MSPSRTDFNLRIGGEPAAARVEAVGPAGSASEVVDLTLLPPGGAGSALFERVVAGSVRDLYEQSRAQLPAGGRLRLHIELVDAAPALRALPWEALRDPHLVAAPDQEQAVSVERLGPTWGDSTSLQVGSSFVAPPAARVRSNLLLMIAAVTLALVIFGLLARLIEARVRSPRPDDARPLLSVQVGKQVTGLAWSATSDQLATGDATGMLALWDTTTGTRRQNLAGGARVEALAWGPNGQRLAVARQDGRVEIWEPMGTAAPQSVGRHQGPALALAWAPDGSRLASGGADGTVRIWTPGAPAPPLSLQGPTDPVIGVAWSTDGLRLAAAFGDRVAIWTVGDWKLAHLLELPAKATSLAWSPDGQRLAIGLTDKSAQVRSGDDWADERVLTGHEEAISAVAWSPDGRLASASHDGTVRLWPNAPGGEPEVVAAADLPVFLLAWSPNGGRLACGLATGIVRVWRTDPEPA